MAAFGPVRMGERFAVRRIGLQVAQLAFQVCLQPAAAIALEDAQVTDPPLEFLALVYQRAHGLVVPLLRVALQASATDRASPVICSA